jgi:sulfite exporter TauE/SafE
MEPWKLVKSELLQISHSEFPVGHQTIEPIDHADIAPLPSPDLCLVDGVIAPELLLFSVAGLAMATFHCAGMCGPLIMSFQFGMSGSNGSRRILAATTQLLCYQSGRILVYALFGALIGIIGQSLRGQLMNIAAWASLLVAVGFAIAGMARLGLFPTPLNPSASTLTTPLARLSGALLRQRKEAPYSRAFGLGLVMSLLPCGLVFWALGVVASRAHPIDGMALMALLVVYTTPALLAAAVLPAAFQRWKGRLQDRISGIALLVSALWLGLIGGAAVGVWPHASVHIAGHMVRFW